MNPFRPPLNWSRISPAVARHAAFKSIVRGLAASALAFLWIYGWHYWYLATGAAGWIGIRI